MPYGTLYLCATPIGNLQDISLRVLETLRSVDLIACEDTRKTLQLLNHFSISKPVTSYFEHNKAVKGEKILEALRAGRDVALVSDAGMPCVSDPGHELVEQCIAQDIPYTVLPGPVAAVTALVRSGLPGERFSFEGFLPRQKKERLRFLESLAAETRTMLFYEAPHRLLETLQDMEDVFGPRPMAAVRELTKKFEEVVRGTPEEVLAHFAGAEVRGEFVLVLTGAAPAPRERHDLSWAAERAASLKAQGMPQKDAVRQAALEAGLSRRDLYNYIVREKP